MTFRGNFVGREMDRQAAALRRCRRCGATDRPLTDGRCTPCEKRDEYRRADHARRYDDGIDPHGFSYPEEDGR